MATRCRSPPESCAGDLCRMWPIWSFSTTSATRGAISSGLIFRSASGKRTFSSAVMCGKSARFWNTIATLRRAGETWLTGFPSISTSPSSGFSSPRMSLRMVVLPESGGPNRQKNSLSAISKLTSLTAPVSPKRLVTFRNAIEAISAPPRSRCRCPRRTAGCWTDRSQGQRCRPAAPARDCRTRL